MDLFVNLTVGMSACVGHLYQSSLVNSKWVFALTGAYGGWLEMCVPGSCDHVSLKMGLRQVLGVTTHLGLRVPLLPRSCTQVYPFLISQ